MRRIHILIGGIIFALLILVVGILEQTGYVISNFSIQKGATLHIGDIAPNSSVYLNNKKEAVVPADETQVIIRGLAHGNHEVLVAHERSWPWIRTIRATASDIVTITPLQIPEDTDGIVIGLDDPRRTSIENLFASTALPTHDSPTIHKGNGARAWIIGTDIYVQTTGEQARLILEATSPIRTLLWHKGHEDVLLIALQNGVFALDIHGEGAQNFQPIYKGSTPRFVIDPEDSEKIFVFDNEYLFSILLSLF